MNDKKVLVEFVRDLIDLSDGIIIEGRRGRMFERLKKYVTRKHVQELVTHIKENPDINIQEFLYQNIPAYNAIQKEHQIQKIAESGGVGDIDGHRIDQFSAYMVNRVMGKMTEEQKIRLLDRPLPEIVTISYRMASRLEF